ncbi:TPA: WGR domain-containing protein [Vibrio cholerae]
MKEQVVYQWYLEHSNSSENKHKFYEVSIVQRGVNSFAVTRRYGRIGTNTKPRDVDTFSVFESALTKGQELVSSKRFSNRDAYSLLRESSPNEVVRGKPAPQMVPVIPEIVIEEEPAVDDSFWTGLKLA